jgi:hypothetical protein
MPIAFQALFAGSHPYYLNSMIVLTLYHTELILIRSYLHLYFFRSKEGCLVITIAGSTRTGDDEEILIPARSLLYSATWSILIRHLF